jgi:hypothetical protein
MGGHGNGVENLAAMRHFDFHRLLTALALTSIAGCSAASTAAPMQSASSAAQPDAPHPNAAKRSALIYSSSFGGNSVDYYLKGTGPNNPVAGSLSGRFNNPLGMGVDKNGNLYVANSGDENVLVYAAGSTSPTSTLNDPDKFPADVAIGSDGTAYVANGFGPIGASGNVVVYPPGATTPSQVLSNKHFLHVTGDALDKNGNLFVSCNGNVGSGNGTVVEFKPGAITAIETHIHLGFAGGVGFDRQGHLLAIDEEVPSLNVYNPHRSTPLAKLTLPGTSAYFAFDHQSKLLYVSDYGLAEIDVFRYTPTGLTQVNKITNGLNPSESSLGIAMSPAQQL